MTDSIHRFIFDTHGVRGEIVNCSSSTQRMIEGHEYPKLIADLLQKAAVVNVLLAATLKFEGKISLQLQTDNKLKLLLVQTTHDLNFRGIAHYDQAVDYSDLTFNDITEGGQMSITIEPLKGKRYQGIVALDGDNLAECVEGYFQQSEQLKTKIWLYNNSKRAFGLMLQALPDKDSGESFEHLEMLASTLSAEECLSIDSETLLHRLFHQELVNNLLVDNIEFKCDCSRDKMLSALSLLGENEVNEILQEEGEIEITCEFCMNHYSFNEVDIKKHRAVVGNSTEH